MYIRFHSKCQVKLSFSGNLLCNSRNSQANYVRGDAPPARLGFFLLEPLKSCLHFQASAACLKSSADSHQKSFHFPCARVSPERKDSRPLFQGRHMVLCRPVDGNDSRGRVESATRATRKTVTLIKLAPRTV